MIPGIGEAVLAKVDTSPYTAHRVLLVHYALSPSTVVFLAGTKPSQGDPAEQMGLLVLRCFRSKAVIAGDVWSIGAGSMKLTSMMFMMTMPPGASWRRLLANFVRAER
jgi:hypothetical protein